MTRALIVVDVQNDFCEGGSLAVEGGNAVAAGIRDFVDYEGLQYDFIVLTRDWHVNPGAHFASNTDDPTPNFTATWPDHCVANTRGAAFHGDLGEMILTPHAIVSKGQNSAAYSGFEGSVNATEGLTLGEYFKDNGITDVDIVGIAFDYCVKATAIDAAKTVPFVGGRVRVIKELTASVDPSADKAVTAELADAGVQVVRLEEATR